MCVTPFAARFFSRWEAPCADTETSNNRGQIANGIAGYKEQNPGATDQDAMRELLPDVKFVQADNGELALALDGAPLLLPVLCQDAREGREKVLTTERCTQSPSSASRCRRASGSSSPCVYALLVLSLRVLADVRARASQDASRRGDSLGDSVSSVLAPKLAALRTVTARWFLSAVADSVVEELNASAGPASGGVGGSGRGAGLAGRLAGAAGVREGRRAEWNGGGARWV